MTLLRAVWIAVGVGSVLLAALGLALVLSRPAPPGR